MAHRINQLIRILREQVLERPTAEKVCLKDGTEIIIRPARAEDVSGIDGMHERSSPTSLYFRYLTPFKPRSEDTHRWCRIKRRDGGCLVAVSDLDGTIVGMACFVKGTDGVAEPGILVEDRFQGRGLGRHLWERLIRCARSRQVSLFDAIVHPENDRILAFVNCFSHPATTIPDRDGNSLRIYLDADRYFEESLFRFNATVLPGSITLH